MSNAPLTVIDSQLMVPQAEWDLLAQAANNHNFAIDLQGKLMRTLATGPLNNYIQQLPTKAAHIISNLY
jgi:hypothetical protein